MAEVSSLVVGVAATPRPWRQDLATYARDHVADLVVRTIRDPERVFDEHLHAVLVDDVSTLLTRPWLARARAAGLRLVGVYDPTGLSGRGERYLRDLGVDRTIPATATPEEMVTALLQLAETLDDDQLAADLAARAGLLDEPAAPHGSITAIGGPGGAGSTEVAICLADRLQARARSTVLVEANEDKPCLVRRMGLSPSPHLLHALRAAHLGEPPISECFASREFAAGRPVAFSVIAGIPKPADWPLVRRADVAQLLDALRDTFDEIVVDVAGHCDELGHGMPERWAASRGALQAADRLIGVCPATGPAGVTAFLDWLAEVGALRPPPALVAVNRMPRGRPARRQDLDGVLRTHLPPAWMADLRWLPQDPALADAAWEGRLAGKCPFALAVDGIASLMAPQPARPVRRGVLR